MAEEADGAARARSGGRGVVRGTRNLAAGLSLVVLALIALVALARLEAGTLRAMGPGMLPRTVAVLVGLAGVALAVLALKPGDAIGRWPVRGPILVCLGIAAFALTIRSVGLAVAGPLVVVVSGLASPDVRPRELAIFAVVITGFCVALFRYALGLPIPVLVLPGLTL